MAPADRRRVHLDGAAHGGLLQPPAVLRPRHDGRGGEGLTDLSTPERRWRAIALATVLVTVSFWALFYGLGEAFAEGAVADEQTVVQATSALGLSLILVPAVFATAAFVSARDDAPIGTLAGMGVFVALGAILLVLPPPNPLAALIAGYTGGAVVTLSRPQGMSRRNRWIATGVVVVVVFVGFLTVPAAIAWLAPAMPFTAMGIADAYTPRTESDVGVG